MKHLIKFYSRKGMIPFLIVPTFVWLATVVTAIFPEFFLGEKDFPFLGKFGVITVSTIIWILFQTRNYLLEKNEAYMVEKFGEDWRDIMKRY